MYKIIFGFMLMLLSLAIFSLYVSSAINCCIAGLVLVAFGLDERDKQKIK